ncbi:MAG: hypothetical protein P8X80_03245 [Desulfobacterales bacterium]|jgi:hypothetical protein
MIPTSDALMIDGKRGTRSALAVYRVNTRPIGGCFYRRTLKSNGKNEYEKMDEI